MGAIPNLIDTTQFSLFPQRYTAFGLAGIGCWLANFMCGVAHYLCLCGNTAVFSGLLVNVADLSADIRAYD